jgi:hypothetical protein
VKRNELTITFVADPEGDPLDPARLDEALADLLLSLCDDPPPAAGDSQMSSPESVRAAGGEVDAAGHNGGG